MSKHPSQEAYEKAKARHKARAQEKEIMIQEDLHAIRLKYMPRNLKGKILTGCVMFGAVYLAEELIFRKKLPGILKFTGAVAATALAPKAYVLIQDHFLTPIETTALEEIPTLPAETDEKALESEENVPEQDL